MTVPTEPLACSRPPGVVDEGQVRVAAGIAMAVGAVAFAYANFDKLFWPIRTTSSILVVDFALRLTLGLERSPTGLLARWTTRRRRPEWVSVGPKRFAWSLGLAMAATLAAITNAGVHGPLPRTICLVCLALMWLESVFGLCLGCQLYRVAVQRGWRRSGDDGVVCAGGVCDLDPMPDQATQLPLASERWPRTR